jgi:hypothetical protein
MAVGAAVGVGAIAAVGVADAMCSVVDFGCGFW